jgi:hypothetical protein
MEEVLPPPPAEREEVLPPPPAEVKPSPHDEVKPPPPEEVKPSRPRWHYRPWQSCVLLH